MAEMSPKDSVFPLFVPLASDPVEIASWPLVSQALANRNVKDDGTVAKGALTFNFNCDTFLRILYHEVIFISTSSAGAWRMWLSVVVVLSTRVEDFFFERYKGFYYPPLLK